MARKKAEPAAAVTEATVTSLGYPQCEWRADTERCRFPGSVSASGNGSGPWYCSGHMGCHDPIVGADIVHASRDYAPLTPRQSDDALVAAAKAWRGDLQRRPFETPEAHRGRLRGALRAMCARRVPPGLDWAHKILARAEAGESIDVYALRIAQEAVHESSRDQAEAA